MTQQKSFSRHSHAPEACQPQRQNRFASGKKREAERRKAHSNQSRATPTNVPACRCPGAEGATQTSGRSLRTYLLAGRARLPALRRGSRQNSYILAQLQAMLPGTWFRRALPAFSCPSPVEAPHASAVVPKRMMPKAAPAQVASLRGSTALAPHFRSHPECVPR